MKNLFIFILLLLPCVAVAQEDIIEKLQKCTIRSTNQQTQPLSEEFIQLLKNDIESENTRILDVKNGNVKPTINCKNDIIAVTSKTGKSQCIDYYLTETGKKISSIRLKKPLERVAFLSNYILRVENKDGSSEQIDISKNVNKATGKNNSDFINPDYKPTFIPRENISGFQFKDSMEEGECIAGGPDVYISTLRLERNNKNFSVAVRTHNVKKIEAAFTELQKITQSNNNIGVSILLNNIFESWKQGRSYALLSKSPIFLALGKVIQELIIKRNQWYPA